MAAAYHFLTQWRLPGTALEAVAVLSDPLDLPRWWPSVYLQAEEVEPPGADGSGQAVRLLTKGRLPYRLRWSFRVTQVESPAGPGPHTLALSAWGDFVGEGLWTIRDDSADVVLQYDWRVRTEKPLLRRLSWLLRPLFAWNHRWAMAEGERSLRRELERRRAAASA